MSDNEKNRRTLAQAVRSAAVVAGFAVRRVQADRGIQTAGSLTFTTLLSLVPMITVVVALTTAFPVFDAAMQALESYLVKNILPDTGGVRTITAHIASFARRAGRLTGISLAALAVTSIMLMMTIDEALNRIFRVQRRRPFMQRLLMYWAVLTLGPLLIGASLWMTSFVIGQSLGMLDMSGLNAAALRLVPFVFTCAALTLLYAVVPYRQIELRDALAGGVVAGLLFELVKRGFGLYIAKFPTYSLIYGTFAAVPIFLLWVYLSWLVVLAGATLTALLPAARLLGTEHRRRAGQDLSDALAVLAALAGARRDGSVRGLTQIAAQARVLPHRCERMLARCAALGWAARSDREGWLLARDAASIRVADVYRAFALDPQVSAATAAASRPLAAGLAAHDAHLEQDLGFSLAELADTGDGASERPGRSP